MINKLLPFTMILLLLYGCSPAVSGSPTQIPEPQKSPDPTASIEPTPSAAPVSNQESPKTAAFSLPLPTGEMFGLNGMDAVLYDTVVSNYSTKGLVTDLHLPSLAVLDTYKAEDGNTCYVCWIEVNDYYNLGYGLNDLNSPEYTYCSLGSNLARFTIWKDYDGNSVCTEILRSVSGDNWSWQKSVAAICGPNKELAQALTEFKKPTVDVRYLTPSDPTKLLDTYLDYCFRASPANRVCVKLPLPSSEMFGLKGIDAALYDGAVESYSTKMLKFGLSEDLLLPSLAVLDSYKAEDGSTCYICMFRQYDYYDLGYGLGDLNNPQYSPGGGSNVARFTISKTENGDPVCTEVFEGYDGEGWASGVKIICGPKEELAEAIIKNKALPVEKRNITPSGVDELLNRYLDYYFK